MAAVDGGVLTPEKLRTLADIAPTEEECVAVAAYTGAAAKLPTVERFFQSIGSLPAVRTRAKLL
jgi:hypothetical protein